jgi:hypothetical protein
VIAGVPAQPICPPLTISVPRFVCAQAQAEPERHGIYANGGGVAFSGGVATGVDGVDGGVVEVVPLPPRTPLGVAGGVGVVVLPAPPSAACVVDVVVDVVDVGGVVVSPLVGGAVVVVCSRLQATVTAPIVTSTPAPVAAASTFNFDCCDFTFDLYRYLCRFSDALSTGIRERSSSNRRRGIGSALTAVFRLSHAHLPLFRFTGNLPRCAASPQRARARLQRRSHPRCARRCVPKGRARCNTTRRASPRLVRSW